MKKNFFILILFIFVSSCGYEAIHSKKNSSTYDFSIDKISFIGDRDVNLKIKRLLNNYTLTKKNKKFTLKIATKTEKTELAKNIKGNSTSFKKTITVNVEVFVENKLKNNIQILESFTYKNNNNKFELKGYEKEITNNLAETVSEKLVFKLSNIQ